MNELIKTLAETSAEKVIDLSPDAIMRTESGSNKIEIPDTFIEAFSQAIVQEHLKLLRLEWYELNNQEVPDQISARDIGLHVGKKSEIIMLMEKIKKHFGVDE
jgi:hypothetical protein